MQVVEAVSQYVDQVGMLEKRLASASKNFYDDYRILTMFGGVTVKYATTRDQSRELGKKYDQEIAMQMKKADGG